MQIVIEIDENLYTRLFDNGVDNYDDAVDMAKAIRNGTPLPEGHGRLVDAEKLYVDISEREELARQRVIDTPSNITCYMRYMAQLNERTAFKEMLYDAPTIIEANTTESEDKE